MQAKWLRRSTLVSAVAILGTGAMLALAVGNGVSAAVRTTPTASQAGGVTVVKTTGPNGTSSTAYYGKAASTLAEAQLNAEEEGLSGAATASLFNASNTSAAIPDSYVYQYVQLDVCPVAGCLVEDVLEGYWEYNGSYAYEESVTGGCSYTIGWYCSTIHTENLISQAPPAPYVEKYGSYNLGVTCIPYAGLGGCVTHLIVELYIFGYPSGAHSTYWDEY